MRRSRPNCWRCSASWGHGCALSSPGGTAVASEPGHSARHTTALAAGAAVAASAPWRTSYHVQKSALKSCDAPVISDRGQIDPCSTCCMRGGFCKLSLVLFTSLCTCLMLHAYPCVPFLCTIPYSFCKAKKTTAMLCLLPTSSAFSDILIFLSSETDLGTYVVAVLE